MIGHPADWCILRMAAPRTVTVVQSLARVGIEAWTPTEIVERRVSRGKAKRKTAVALLATFAFARADHLPELFAIIADPVSDHPDFSILRLGDGVALVDDADLDGLRQFERDTRRAAERKAPPPQFKVGDEVTVPRDAFASMNGVVVETKPGKFVVVAFPGCALQLKASPWDVKAA